jgi:hypothetical protein
MNKQRNGSWLWKVGKYLGGVLLLGLYTLNPFPAYGSPQEKKLTGYVMDKDGDVVEGAFVHSYSPFSQIVERVGRTNSEGEFAMESPTNSSQLIVSYRGRRDLCKPKTVGGGYSGKINFVLPGIDVQEGMETKRKWFGGVYLLEAEYPKDFSTGDNVSLCFYSTPHALQKNMPLGGKGDMVVSTEERAAYGKIHLAGQSYAPPSEWDKFVQKAIDFAGKSLITLPLITVSKPLEIGATVALEASQVSVNKLYGDLYAPSGFYVTPFSWEVLDHQLWRGKDSVGVEFQPKGGDVHVDVGFTYHARGPESTVGIGKMVLDFTLPEFKEPPKGSERVREFSTQKEIIPKGKVKDLGAREGFQRFDVDGREIEFFLGDIKAEFYKGIKANIDFDPGEEYFLGFNTEFEGKHLGTVVVIAGSDGRVKRVFDNISYYGKGRFGLLPEALVKEEDFGLVEIEKGHPPGVSLALISEREGEEGYYKTSWISHMTKDRNYRKWSWTHPMPSDPGDGKNIGARFKDVDEEGGKDIIYKMFNGRENIFFWDEEFGKFVR